MRLSIIVPVFNQESDNKLIHCLDSLINQTMDDYEILAVDDCSTDNSMDILNDYGSRYPDRFVAIHGEVNHHQGGAKNIGLKKATGEWISFIDADDWVVPNYYERMIGKAEETGADVVGFDYCLVSEHTFVATERIPNSRKDQVGLLNESRKKSLILDGGSLCTKIFRRESVISNGLFFPEDIFYEDNAVGNSYMILANHFEYIPEPLYFYYQHGDSTVHTFSVSRCDDRLESGRLMIHEAKRQGYFDTYKKELEYAFTLLYYQNTLFTYMACVKPTKYSYVKKMNKEMRDYFPQFENNPYYIERTHAEEKKLMHMAGSSTLFFMMYYKLLWAYRNIRKKRQ